ncbi:hypothetical protein [Nocardia sp. X0981]
MKHAILLRRREADSRDGEPLLQRYGLEVVFTAVIDSVSKLAAAVAIQHVLQHDAETVVVPHLTRSEACAAPPWQAVAAVAELVTIDGVLRYDRAEGADAIAEGRP